MEVTSAKQPAPKPTAEAFEDDHLIRAPPIPQRDEHKALRTIIGKVLSPVLDDGVRVSDESDKPGGFGTNGAKAAEEKSLADRTDEERSCPVTTGSDFLEIAGLDVHGVFVRRDLKNNQKAPAMMTIARKP